MNADKLVPCLETCRKLKEAGIEFGDTYFKWARIKGEDGPMVWFIISQAIEGTLDLEQLEAIPSPTLAELLEWLPDHFYDKKRLIYLRIGKSMGDGLIIRYINADIKEQVCRFQGLNPSESAAQLALWVVENGYKEASK
jgi:hypothetical protein